MRLSTLAKLLGGSLAPVDFQAELEPELRDAARGREERGRAVPIRVTEDVDLLVTPSMIAAALRMYADGALTADALEYIGDVLELAERSAFASDGLADVVYEFSSPDINGAFTIKRAKEILHALSQRT